MPAFDNTTPTLSRTFAGIDFTVPAPFTAGHILTDGEAKWVNTQVAGAVGNAYSGDIRRAEAAKKGSTKDWNHAEKFAARYAEYTLGGSTRGSGTKSATDPIETLARAIASARVKAKIVAKGFTVKAFMDAKMDDGRSNFLYRVDAELEKFADDIYAQAERQHEENLAAVDTSDDDDGLELPTAIAAE